MCWWIHRLYRSGKQVLIEIQQKYSTMAAYTGLACGMYINKSHVSDDERFLINKKNRPDDLLGIPLYL